LGLALALGVPLGAWWPAVGQAHGHVQVFGWGGLMVLGVGLHFLPRLRGAPLAGAGLAPLALGALALGLVLRAVAQPLAAVAGEHALLGAALVLSGALELGGAALAIGLLVATLRAGAALASRAGLRPVLPFFAVAFAALLAGLTANLWSLWSVSALRSDLAGRAVVLLGLEGFLIPVAVAMSMRTFPLYFRTRLPRNGPMQAGLAAWTAGLLLRLAGLDLGPAVQAGGLGLFALGLSVFAPRLPRPRDTVPILADPTQWHALTAYGWLAVAGLVLAGGAREDAERHVLGAGFVTLLILGVGAHMLPGFARRSVRSAGLVWATLLLGNAAAALRALPPLAPAALPTAVVGTTYALAGLLGLAAVAVFAANVVASRGRPER
jgi:uncharacterized protein involved in response to NO